MSLSRTESTIPPNTVEPCEADLHTELRLPDTLDEPGTLDNSDPNRVINFMGCISFGLDPVRALQIIMTSMICGESQYYRPNSVAQTAPGLKSHVMFPEMYSSDTSSSFVSKAIQAALDYDYERTIGLIPDLRTRYLMRLNPQVLLISAIHHPKRLEYSSANPLKLRTIIRESSQIPTDWCTQFELLKASSKPIPSVWKREIALLLEDISPYHAVKYIHGGKTGNGKAGDAGKNKTDKTDKTKAADKTKVSASLVDLIRITHPRSRKNPIIEQIVKTGKYVAPDESTDTWERLRSQGKSWSTIMSIIRIPHMALLRNLRSILEEESNNTDAGSSIASIHKMTEQLEAGVLGGKQFPFRYFSAYRMLKGGDVRHAGRKYVNKTDKTDTPIISVGLKQMVLDSLERCLIVSLSTIPELKGRVDCLSDNSGSAHGAFVSAYGSVKVSEISNLSALMTAMRAEKGGSVWVFGDRLTEYAVNKTRGILEQLDEINRIGSGIGGATETGVWLFWRDAINSGRWLDNVFIYSDMQAGYSNLYAQQSCITEMQNMNAQADKSNAISVYIDVLSLVKAYRKHNPKMNIFSVQVAGYDNAVLPDILYRGAILSGWTGKEANLAYEMIRVWDSVEGV